MNSFSFKGGVDKLRAHPLPYLIATLVYLPFTAFTFILLNEIFFGYIQSDLEVKMLILWTSHSFDPGFMFFLL